MTTHVNGNGHAAHPQITLYTNHFCPFAHRAHITLNELGIPFEEVIIDLDKPREPWYLDVNPRGLVPSLKFSNDTVKDEIITESAIVTQFLADLNPSHLLPPANGSLADALKRARINFFVDTWNTKISPFFFPALKADSPQDKEAKSKEWAAAIEKEIEPLLKDAAPFFGGSSRLTFAEVQAAPWVLRWYALSKRDIIPKSFFEHLDRLPNFSKWAKAVREDESCTCIWDEDVIMEKANDRIAKLRAQKSGCPFAGPMTDRK